MRMGGIPNLQFRIVTKWSYSHNARKDKRNNKKGPKHGRFR